MVDRKPGRSQPDHPAIDQVLREHAVSIVRGLTPKELPLKQLEPHALSPHFGTLIAYIGEELARRDKCNPSTQRGPSFKERARTYTQQIRAIHESHANTPKTSLTIIFERKPATGTTG